MTKGERTRNAILETAAKLATEEGSTRSRSAGWPRRRE